MRREALEMAVRIGATRCDDFCKAMFGMLDRPRALCGLRLQIAFVVLEREMGGKSIGSGKMFVLVSRRLAGGCRGKNCE